MIKIIRLHDDAECCLSSEYNCANSIIFVLFKYWNSFHCHQMIIISVFSVIECKK